MYNWRKGSPGSGGWTEEELMWAGACPSEGLTWALSWQIPAAQERQCGWNRVIGGKRSKERKERVVGTAF